MALNYAEAMDNIWTVIANEELDDWFSEHYDEQLEKCDVFMEKGHANEIPLKTLKEYVDERNSYTLIREVIESIKKFKEDFEKEKRLKESYKNIVKKQQETIKKLKEENKEHKKELLIASFNGYKEGCNYKQSVQDEVDFLNESGESQELIKEVFDESYQGGLNLVYNIETKDYEEYQEEEEEEDSEEEICSECKRKKEDKSDMFVTIRELDGTEYIMCGMCSLTHFQNKRDGLKNKGKGANKGDEYVPSEEEEEYDDLTEQEKIELEKAEAIYYKR
jgi:hypothetical protein